MRYLIAGATGYTGSSLVSSLISKNHSVGVLTRAPHSFLKKELLANKNFEHLGSFATWTGLEELNYDCVISLIGHSVNDHTYSDIQHLVSGLIETQTQVLEIGRQLNCPVVLPGSYWENVISSKNSNLNLYSLFSQMMSRLTDFFFKEYGVSSCRVLLSDTYGPNDWRQKLITRLIEYSPNAPPIELGNPNQIVLPIYISDVVNALEASIEALVLKKSIRIEFELNSTDVITLGDLVALVQSKIDNPIEVKWNRRLLFREDILEYEPLFEPPTDWLQSISLSEGLDLMIECLSKASDISTPKSW